MVEFVLLLNILWKLSYLLGHIFNRFMALKYSRVRDQFDILCAIHHFSTTIIIVTEDFPMKRIRRKFSRPNKWWLVSSLANYKPFIYFE